MTAMGRIKEIEKMLNRLRRIFSAPIFENEEQTRLAGLLNLVLLYVIGGLLIILPTLALTTTPENVLPLLFVISPYLLANIAAYAMMRRGRVTYASNIFIVSLGVAIFLAYAASPPESIGSAMGFLVLIAFTTLLLDARAVARLIVFVILFTLAISAGRANSWIVPVFTKAEGAYSEWISMTAIYFLTGIGLILSSRSLHRALLQARASAREARTSNEELAGLRDALERRVVERTAELKLTSQQNEKRARDLQTISEIGRAISSEQGLERLLPLITSLVSDRFGFYHVGIFLNDPVNQYTVLAAANSPGGKVMLERGHKLKIDEEGIVGYVTGKGIPRIALDVGADAAFFNNPDLPTTRSEMGLPLKIGGKTIGALDVQSSEPSAFTNEDVASLSILADQVSIAIDNTRLYEATRKSLEQTEAAYRRYLQGEWQHLTQEESTIGYRFSAGTSTPLQQPVVIQESARVLDEGKLYHREGAQNNGAAELTVPVKLRGEVIGLLNISMPGREHWLDDEIDIAEAVAERLALAVENARLFQATNTRAERERLITDISSKISGTIHMESLLQTAAQELGQALNGSEVLIQIHSAGGQAGGPE